MIKSIEVKVYHGQELRPYAVSRNGTPDIIAIRLTDYGDIGVSLEFINKRGNVLNAGAHIIPAEAIDELAIQWLKQNNGYLKDQDAQNLDNLATDWVFKRELV
jgi:hypothetical protein